MRVWRSPVRVWLATLFATGAVILAIKWLVFVRHQAQLTRWRSNAAGAVGEREIRIGDRPVLLYIPTSYRAERTLALVIACHGRNQKHDRFAQQLGLEEWAERNGFLLAAPAGLTMDGERQWTLQGPRDVQFIDDLRKRLAREYTLDSRRQYIYGFSAGGYFALVYGLKRSDGMAAFGMNSGGWIGWPATQRRKVPAIFVHGARDSIVPIGDMDEATKMLRGTGHEIKVVRVESGGHALFADKLQEVWNFFLAHPLPKEAS